MTGGRYKSVNDKHIKLGREWVKRYFQKLSELRHHGIKGQKWGVRNGPPYPLKDNKNVANSAGKSNIVEDAIRSGMVSKTINIEKQMRHTKTGHTPGRSYLDGDFEYAQKLINKLSGSGETKIDRNGNWNHRERVVSPHIIGTYVSETGTETKSNVGMIVYSKTGSHIYPVRRKEKREENET